MIQRIFPFVSDRVVAMLHVRRCGWMSAQQFGSYLLQQGKAKGVEFIKGRVDDVTVEDGQVRSVLVETSKETLHIQTNTFVIAAGPFQKQVATFVGVDLPVFNELHPKVAFKDTMGITPCDVPLIIWDDPIHLYWTEEEKKELAASEETRWLLDRFPAGVHFRPEGKGDNAYLLGIWTYDVRAQEPVAKPVFEPEYSEVVLRGLIRMIPGLRAYVGRMSKPYVDGGYYCKTQENRPLIGPLPVKGAYVFGAISGFGIMGGMAGGELLAAHITGDELPQYAEDFSLSRYRDPAYQELLKNWEATSGQL
jgi:glycine/D-amino acid oxidase-like deaminating enzyme